MTDEVSVTRADLTEAIRLIEDEWPSTYPLAGADTVGDLITRLRAATTRRKAPRIPLVRRGY